MGYPTPLRAIHRRLNQTTVIASTPFTRGSSLQFGNRMAVIALPSLKKLIVWSAIPLGEEFQKAIDAATEDHAGDYEIAVAIIPDKEHTLSAVQLKKTFPHVFLVGPSGITDKPDLKLDYEFKDSEANVVIDGATIKEELKGLSFVFLNGHANRELAVVDQATKTVFEADLLFNIPWNGDNHDQYPHGSQNAGFSGYLTRNLNSESTLGRFMHKRLLKDTKENRQGIKALLGLDFDTVVLSHGAVIEKDGKAAFKRVFSSYI